MSDVINSTITNVLSILNDSSKLTEALSNRVGSFFFGPDQEITYSRHMPKGQVTTDDLDITNKSFGNTFYRNKDFVINVFFFTKRGESASGTTHKNQSLVNYYLDLIENSIITNQSSIGSATIVGFGTTSHPPYDTENNIYVGVKPIVFRRRENG